MTARRNLFKNKWTWIRILEVIVIITVLVSYVFLFIDRIDALGTRVSTLEKTDGVRNVQYNTILEKLDELIKLHPRQ